MPASKKIPEPWNSFLRELHEKATEVTRRRSGYAECFREITTKTQVDPTQNSDKIKTYLNGSQMVLERMWLL